MVPVISKPHGRALAATFLLLAVLGARPNAASAQPTAAHDASRFVDSIGVNIHTFFNRTRYYERYEEVTSALLDLGVRHVRDGHQGRRTDQFTRLNFMADRGIKITLIEDPRSDPRYTPTDELRSLEDRIAELEAGQIRGVEALEGANEFNRVGPFAPHPGPMPEWMPRLIAAQRKLFELNQRQLRLPLYGPTFTTWQAYAHAGDAGLAAWIPIAAIHPYPGGWAPTAAATGSLAWNRSRAVEPLMGRPNAPYVATETGYHNAMDWTGGHPPAPEDVSGAYIPKLVLEYFRQGSQRTFLYELVDTWPSSDMSERENHFGLFRNRVDENGNFLPLEWKPAAVNLRNLISLLNVPGSRRAPTRLDYSLRGDTAGVYSLLFRRADGKLAIAIWQDVELWNPDTRTRLDPPAKTVTVALGGAKTASFSSFLVSRGTAPSGPAQNGSRATVSVPAGDTVILTVAAKPSPRACRWRVPAPLVGRAHCRPARAAT